MVDVPGVNVGSGGEQKIDDSARASEVERRLSVAAALVDAGRVFGDDAGDEIDAVEMRRRARVGNRARREQTLCDARRRAMQRKKAAGSN